MNPVRTFESHGVEDQTSEEWNAKKSCIGRPHNPDAPAETYNHHMISIKTGSPKVPYVEQCTDCAFVDPSALEWWADNAVKLSLNDRARRIAVATDTEPFSFVNSTDHPDLDLDEILAQAMGAVSMCWDPRPHNAVFDSTCAKAIWTALAAEVDKALADAKLSGKFEAHAENATSMKGQVPG